MAKIDDRYATCACIAFPVHQGKHSRRLDYCWKNTNCVWRPRERLTLPDLRCLGCRSKVDSLVKHWALPIMDMLLGQRLLKKTGEVVDADEALKDKKIICYYFSAHWCPPCRNFTPILYDFYNVRPFFNENFAQHVSTCKKEPTINTQFFEKWV